jgi:ubiquinone/menaquinone biosynthesis C-methylase UbiE
MNYIHGTSLEEQERLSRLNDLLNEKSLRKLALKRGDCVLDVGAGLGQLTFEMARQTGVRVVAVESSPTQIDEATRRAESAGCRELLDLRNGDARALPLSATERGSFDVAHARFLLEHVPEPLQVVREMVSAVKLGGRIVLEDDDHDVMRLWPEPAGFTRVWHAYMRCFDRMGNDPIVGRRLVQLLVKAGARPRRNTWVFFGSCAGQADFRGFAENLINVVAQARDIVVPIGIEHRELDAVIERMVAWADLPDAALWYAMSWAEGVRTAEERG